MFVPGTFIMGQLTYEAQFLKNKVDISHPIRGKVPFELKLQGQQSAADVRNT